jgi:hypothetical protein
MPHGGKQPAAGGPLLFSKKNILASYGLTLMSATNPSAETTARRRARRALRPVSRSWQAGIIVGFASMIIFSLAAMRLAAAGFVPASVAVVWNSPNVNTTLGGQWLQVALIWIIQKIPGSSAATLSIVTVISASFVQGFITHDLIRRGWSPLQASLSVGLTALHPIMLSLATSGSPLLMYAILASFVIIALDRMEAIGDTQSLIVLGLLIGVVMLSWPNGIYFLLPLLPLLPWAFRDIENYSAAMALYVIALAPMVIGIAAVALGGTLFDISARDALMIWASPLHGANPELLPGSAWLAAFGGKFFISLADLFLLCMVLMPRNIIVLVRFAFDLRERSNPATGLAALVIPPLAGALATYYWQLLSPWTTISISFMCVTAWAATVQFRNWERWLWVASISVGVPTAWLTPLLWHAAEQHLWRQIIL